MKKTILFFAALFVIPVIDYIWLAQLMGPFYFSELGSLARMKSGVFDPLLTPALVVYVCLALGVVLFVLPKASSVKTALSWGSLLGFVIYGVYDMTNLSLVKNWPLHMSLIDIAWGSFLCGISAVIIYQIKTRF